jgi:hypothetical protein
VNINAHDLCTVDADKHLKHEIARIWDIDTSNVVLMALDAKAVTERSADHRACEAAAHEVSPTRFTRALTFLHHQHARSLRWRCQFIVRRTL